MARLSLSIDRRPDSFNLGSSSTRKLYDIGRVKGLQTEWDTDCWVFEPDRPRSNNKIYWDRQLCNGTLLTDPVNASLLETARRFLAISVNVPGGFFAERCVAYNLHLAFDLLAIIDWAVSLGHQCLADASPADWDKYKQDIKYGSNHFLGKPSNEVTSDRILSVFRVFQQVFDMYKTPSDDGSYFLNDGLRFKPFNHPGEAISIAQDLGKTGGITDTLPPQTALYFINAAIEYVANYSDDIIKLSDELDQLRLSPTFGRQEYARRAPGEAMSDFAGVLMKRLDRALKAPLSIHSFSKSEIANDAGMNVTVLYKPKYSSFIQQALKAATIRDDSSRRRACERLSAKLIRLQRPRRTRVYNRTVKFPRVGESEARQLNLPFKGESGKAAPWPIVKVGSRNRGDSLEEAIVNLWNAVYVVIGVFMADRTTSIMETEVDCLSEGSDGYYLRTSTTKESNTALGLTNARPCPDIVAKAVDVAIRLGRNARVRTHSNKLFMGNNRLGDSVPESSSMRNRLKRFSQSINLPANDDFEHWLLKSQELRRFFATAWVWYYELGEGLDALKQHLRHTDINTSLIYGRAQMRGDTLSEEQRALTLTVLEKAALGWIDLRGPGGQRMMKMFLRMRMHVTEPDRLIELIKRNVQRRNTALIPMPWGYCVWEKDAHLHAKCISHAEGEEISRARPSERKSAMTCVECANYLMSDAHPFSDFWKMSLERHRRIKAMVGAPEVLVEASTVGEEIALRYAS